MRFLYNIGTSPLFYYYQMYKLLIYIDEIKSKTTGIYHIFIKPIRTSYNTVEKIAGTE